MSCSSLLMTEDGKCPGDKVDRKQKLGNDISSVVE